MLFEAITNSGYHVQVEIRTRIAIVERDQDVSLTLINDYRNVTRFNIYLGVRAVYFPYYHFRWCNNEIWGFTKRFFRNNFER